MKGRERKKRKWQRLKKNVSERRGRSEKIENRRKQKGREDKNIYIYNPSILIPCLHTLFHENLCKQS